MTNWITSGDRKKHQRRMNKLMRDLNNNIKNDNLWRGRFYVRQDAAQWYQYSDKSGYELWVVLELCDRKTGQTKRIAETVNHWSMWGGSHLFWQMNQFIVDDVEVWSENPRPGTKEWFNEQ